MSIDNYLIKQTDGEQERLNKQYKFFKEMGFAGRTIFDATYALPRDAKVLDSATGTGAWLLDLAKSVPATVQLYGIDLSRSLFPAPHPSNMHFIQQSVMSLPPEWSNTFDLINQRLLLGALRTADWPIVIAEQFRVLKLGVGQIQLLEPTDWLPMNTPSQRRIHTFVHQEFEKKGLDPDCGAKLPQYLLAAGFCDVNVHVQYVPLGIWAREEGIGGMEVVRAAKMAFLEGALRVAAPNMMSREECEQDMREIEREWNENPGLFFKLHVVEARKP